MRTTVRLSKSDDDMLFKVTVSHEFMLPSTDAYAITHNNPSPILDALLAKMRQEAAMHIPYRLLKEQLK